MSEPVQGTEDEQVMSRVQAGRVEMLALLFERHHMRLYNYLLRLTQDRSLSEDLVQETFLRILRYRDSYRREAKFTTWMFQIANNLHLDHLKRTRPQTPLEDVAEARLSVPPDQGTILWAEQERSRLSQALARLSPTHRQILLLSRYQGMKYAQIAEVLGYSVASVKVLVHRSVAELRNHFSEITGGAS